MVRLQPTTPLIASSISPAFNPTMVRLQLESNYPLVLRIAQLSIPLWCDCNRNRSHAHRCRRCHFQSHYGAIATLFNIPPNSLIENFQSHYGAIATRQWLKSFSFSLTTFNPTMVRLQHMLLRNWVMSVSCSFNPTMVRLQHDCCDPEGAALSAFNPTMVRLQLRNLEALLQ